MSVDTWVSLGALLSVGAVLIGYMRDLKDELKDDIDSVKADIERLDSKIDEARQEAKTDTENLRTYVEQAFGRIETRLTSLEQRTYDIKPAHRRANRHQQQSSTPVSHPPVR